MRGYDSTSYGDGFADVYDDWYADVSDVDSTVALVSDLAGTDGRVLELGVGTGRLAVPMAAAGLQVTGIDASVAMLDKLADRDPDHGVTVIAGDMVTDLPPGPFDVALVAYNTIFNLLEAGAQAACFSAVAAALRPGGHFVVEAFVPDPDAAPGSNVDVRSMAVDRVVLAASVNDPEHQRADGQFIELTEGGVRLRPWSIRWSTPDQLDEMATAAGFTRTARTEDPAATPFTQNSKTHITTYTKTEGHT